MVDAESGGNGDCICDDFSVMVAALALTLTVALVMCIGSVMIFRSTRWHIDRKGNVCHKKLVSIFR